MRDKGQTRSIAAAMALAMAALAGAPLAQTPPTKQDSGWVSLFNGTDFTGFYTYFKGAGYTPTSVSTQQVFKIENGMIHVVPPAGNGYLGTIRQYSHYKVRVEYMWPVGTLSNSNAGLMVHLDSAQVFSRTITADNRPRSIEVNMRRDMNSPWTLWSAQNLGPYLTSTVSSAGSFDYQPDGVAWTNDPWTSSARTLNSSLPNPELPLGQWNRGEAHLHGDSGVFILNGQVRTRAWNFQVRANANNANPRIPCTRGNIGLQSEGAEIWYRNFEIMELDSVTGKPLHGAWGCTNPSSPKYNPAAKVDDGSCGVTAVAAGSAARPAPPGLVLNAHGSVRIRIPEGHTGADIFNLQGKKVWSRRGMIPGDFPVEVEKGLLRIRLAP